MDRLEQAKLVLKYATDEIERLEAERAEAEKPVLRHGDYGYGKDNSHRVTLHCDMKTVTAGDGSVNNTNAVSNERYYPSPVLGNIFDDLKAMAEDLTEFEFAETDRAYQFTAVSNDYTVMLTDSGGHIINVDLKDIPAFILNLRKLQATQERAKNGNTH